MVLQYILNNCSILDIIDHWLPPYYIQDAFGLTSSYLFDIHFWSFPIYTSARKQEYFVLLYMASVI